MGATLAEGEAMEATVLAELTVNGLIEHISSRDIVPGAGAAGAVCLALASACAAKAVVISLKHSPEDARLSTSLDVLKGLCASALHGADVDSQLFEEFIRHKDSRAAGKLVNTGETMARLIVGLLSTIDGVESHIDPSMKGDLIAAKALATAARTIQRTNETEIKRSRPG
jgi:hypothetical protein